MARKKKNINFKLSPEWMFHQPIDFEYNKYTLLGYLQKCEKKFDNLEIYPDFVELSLHLANTQSLIKENTLLLTDKEFESPDDEILLRELFPKKPPKLSQEEEIEIQKTIKFSNEKLIDAFNIAKSIWGIAYENIHISVRKNKENIPFGLGFSYYINNDENIIYVWEFSLERLKTEDYNNKTKINLIYSGSQTDITFNSIIEEKSTWKDSDHLKNFSVIEVKTSQKFPMTPTFIPIMKRKITALIYTSMNAEKMDNFDIK